MHGNYCTEGISPMDATLMTEKMWVKTASHLAFEGVKGNTS